MEKQTRQFNTDEAYDRFTALMASSGLREALAYLLKLSDYRYIAIFRFQNGKANAAVYYDRDNPAVLRAEEVPESATYCGFVRDGKRLFATANALQDPRLAGHPARATVLAYCGLPILDSGGQFLGTLCHYDLVPRDPEQLDLDLLLRVASLLWQGNHVPPYPAV